MRIMGLLISVIFLHLPAIADTHREEVRLPLAIDIMGMGGFYGFALTAERDESTPLGWLLPQTCDAASSKLSVGIPSEVLSAVSQAFLEASGDIGRKRNWSRQDFLEFNGVLSDLIESRFPGNGGFYWEARDWFLTSWMLDGEHQRDNWRDILCDHFALSAEDSPSNRFDALVIYLASNKSLD